MTQQTVNIHSLSNGMTLVAETMADVSSAAFVFLVPAGVAHDPENLTGTANVLAELVFRGAGDLDNRALNEQLDSLGLHRHSGVATLFSTFGGALVADNLLPALKLHADIITKPHLSAEQFASCRELALQALDSLEDDPRQKISLLVHEKFLPYPFGRPAPGKKPELQKLDYTTIKQHFAQRYCPEGTILAIAGKVDFGKLKYAIEQYFSAWTGPAPAQPDRGACKAGLFHQQNEGAQVHVGVMYPSVSYADDDYYAALAAAGVLSGGMGSRLFTEVREKRGLCYAVIAAHQVVGGYGAVQCYLGSTPDRAQEALDITLAELKKLGDGITTNELDRAKVGLRATLIMQGESSSARALGCASDYYHLGRVRSLTEIEQAIQSLTVDDVLTHARRHQPADFAVATIGPKKLNLK